jgi:hypothetical protein
MPKYYTDTILNQFPFSQVAEHERRVKDRTPKESIFDFDYYDDEHNPNPFQREDEDEINRIIREELRRPRRVTR